VINGRKRFITNAPVANLFVVFARTRPPTPRAWHRGVPGAADTPGVEVGVKDAKMGQEGAWTADVTSPTSGFRDTWSAAARTSATARR
jgi:acyl-CoA dehydrogenase